MMSFPKLKRGDEGKFAAIDIETGTYENDVHELAACNKLSARIPDAQVWLVRVGSRYLHRFGGDNPMESLPQELLSAALHVKWERGHSEDQRAVELIGQQVPGYSAEQYGEASRLAAALDAAACELAVAWFAGNGPGPTMAELQARFPGFSWDDYGEAVENNILWARK
jgi:hypothetical protein